MKVGILTFHIGGNYGGYLQAYCLMDAVRKLGHEVAIINYKNKVHWNAEHRFQPWVYRRPGRFWHDLQMGRAFKQAFKRMPLSPLKTETDPASVNWNAYDAIIVGSDIVWNCEYPVFGQDPSYFGQFPTPYRGRLIAYAPSTGFMKADYAAPDWVATGLRKFHAIAVRDKLTQDFVRRQIGQEVALVADPTWIGSEGTAEGGEFPRRNQDRFLFVYCFKLEAEAVKVLRAFAAERGLRIVAAGYYQPWADENWSNADPIEWAAFFKRADYVLTSTFHGTLFSLKQHARFCVLGNSAIDSKIALPLALTGLEDRRTTEVTAIPAILSQPIDYEIVERKRVQYASESFAFLKASLA